jgi:AraC family transcriptional regulator
MLRRNLFTGTFLDASTGRRTDMLIAWQLQRIDRYVAENLDRGIRVSELASLVRLSSSHFSRSFRSSRGITAGRYLRERRIERAQALMLASDVSLARIATECGLADQAHFCRVFRKITGASPLAWRRERCLLSARLANDRQAEVRGRVIHIQP